MISESKVGNAMKNLIYAVDYHPRSPFSTLCPPNSLTDKSVIVLREVAIESAEKNNKYSYYE